MANDIALGLWGLAALLLVRLLMWVLKQRRYYRKGLG